MVRNKVAPFIFLLWVDGCCIKNHDLLGPDKEESPQKTNINKFFKKKMKDDLSPKEESDDNLTFGKDDDDSPLEVNPKSRMHRKESVLDIFNSFYQEDG